MASYFEGILPTVQKMLKIQKMTIRIITGRRSREFCRNLFKEFKILPLEL
jgi:hypothetical protein